MKNWVKWLLMILSFLMMLVGFFYIPILSTIETKYNIELLPARGIMMLILIPVVVITSLPFIVCIIWIIISAVKNKK